MKIKNKGKVYPSPSDGDHLSVLKLLPAAIVALASVLSLEDREVLAYLITRSIKTTAANSSSAVIRGKASRKAAANGSSNSSNGATHKPPVSDCDCFDCYTSYWFRWDSSPNRELIHQAIEAFEDHLTNGESGNNPNTSKKKYGKAKRRDKAARRLADNNSNVEQLLVEETIKSSVAEEMLPEDGVAVAPVSSPVRNEVVPEVSGESTLFAMVEEEVKTAPVFSSPPAAAGVSSCCSQHKGLVRKVLPDVLGLLNSRLWSLWSPNA